MKEVDEALKSVGSTDTFIRYCIDNNITYCNNGAVSWSVTDPNNLDLSDTGKIINTFFMNMGAYIGEEVYVDVCY
jgi:hypothetical protein